jgi:uncharacterized membrane protein
MHQMRVLCTLDWQIASRFASALCMALGTMKKEPFIPADKPKFFVIAVLSALAGLGVGMLAFIAAHFEVSQVSSVLLPAMFLCWLTMAISFAGLSIGLITGKYRAMAAKPWKDQLW